MVKYVLAVLALCMALLWGVQERGKAKVATAELSSTTAILVHTRGILDALNKEVLRRTELDIAQSAEQARATASVRAVRATINKEAHEVPEPRCSASGTQLDRLRRLTEASNSAVQSASELPKGSP